MTGTITVADDRDLRIPLLWKDDVGTVHAPSGGSASAADAAVVSAVDVAADDTSVVCRIAGDGTTVVTYTNGALMDTTTVIVAMPAPTSVMLDAANAVPVPKGTAA